MSEIAETSKPPHYAVIFTSEGTEGENGYGEMAQKMFELAHEQKGFLGVESARENLGITVSYWATLEDIANWRQNAELPSKMARKSGINRKKHAFVWLNAITDLKESYEYHKRKRTQTETKKCSRRRIEILLFTASNRILP